MSPGRLVQAFAGHTYHIVENRGAQWLSGRVLDSRPWLRVLASPASLRCVLEEDTLTMSVINPSLVLVQPRKTRPYITEILLMGRKESNQTKHC